jgi:thioredoxin 1
MGSAAEFTESNFDTEVMKADKPVVVDFWAPWCGPCRMIAPLVEEMATKYSGSVKVGKVNIDENPQLAVKYNVMSIPTVLVLKNGTVLDRVDSAPSRQRMEAMITKAQA